MQHFEADVIELELGRQIRSIHEEVEMVPVDQLGVSLVAPGFGIEMQA
jgi:hypothetical protein